MSIGWIALHRKLLDSRVFANEGLLKVWIYCLCRANHEKNYVPITTGKGETEVEVKPGDFIFGRNAAAKDLKMNPSTVYKRMQKLENMGNINIKSNSHYSIVSICNWLTYQDNVKQKEQAKEQPSNNQVTGREQASNTDNNVNNDKNENNDNKKSVITIVHDVPNASDSETWQASCRIANRLLESICEYDPTHKYNHNHPSLTGWVKDIDRALRLDGRTEEQMDWMIDYIFKSNGKNSTFWAGNIESGKKLRDKFDTIKNQVKAERSNGRTQQDYSRRKKESDEFLDQYYSESNNKISA